MAKKLIITLPLIFHFFFYVPIVLSEEIVSNVPQTIAAQVVTAPSTIVVSTSSSKQWLFGNKSFIALGMGAVHYPGVENIKSTNDPCLLWFFWWLWLWRTYHF